MEKIKLDTASSLPRYEKWCKSLTDQSNDTESQLGSLTDMVFEEVSSTNESILEIIDEINTLKTSLQMLAIGFTGSLIVFGTAIITILV